MNGRAFSGLLILLVPAVGAYGQSSDVVFERIRIPGGIQENKVVKVVQDSMGFMWLGTWEGIFRYDGYEFAKYDGYKSDSLLEAEFLWDLHVDPYGVIWIAAHGAGLNSFDPTTLEARRYRHRSGEPGSISNDTVQVLLSDRDGTLWVGTRDGLNRMDRATGTFTVFRHAPDDSTSLSGDEIWTLYEDRQGTLWVGASAHSSDQESGLNRFDRESETFRRFLADPDDPTKLISGAVHTMLEDSRGTFWVGSSDDGLHTLDRETGLFTRYPGDPDNNLRLSAPHLNSKDSFNRASMSFIHEDMHGLLWFGAYNGGVTKFDPASGDLKHYEADNENDASLSNNRLYSLLESHDGTLWIGSLSGEQLGLHKISPAPFTHFVGPVDEVGQADFVWSLLESQDGSIWSGNGRTGLHHFDGQTTELIEPFSPFGPPGGPRPRWITGMAETSEGTIWLATPSFGLTRLDPRTHSVFHFRHDSTDSSSLSDNAVNGMLVDSSGQLWVGSRSGTIDRVNPTDGNFTHVLRPADDRFDCSGPAYAIIPMLEARDGSIWIGCTAGLLRISQSGEMEPFTHVAGDPSTIGPGRVTDVAEAPDGSIWAGTDASGLHHLLPDLQAFEHYDPSNSALPDTTVTGVLVDDSSRVWVATTRALTRIDADKGEFRIFRQGEDYGMVRFNWVAAHKGWDGTLFFGGLNGFIGFRPDEVDRSISHVPPKIVLTGFHILKDGDPPIEAASGLRAIPRATAFHLGYDQNDFEIEFVALHYRRPAANRVQYRLEGFEEEWLESSGRGSATYAAVPPGRYTFLARAANSDGIWTHANLAIDVVVDAPWWQSGWAYLSYLFFMAGLVFASFRYYRLKEEEEARISELVRLRLKELSTSNGPLLQSTPIEIRSADEVFLGQLRSAIEARIGDPHLTIESLAYDVGQSVRQLRRRLKVAANLTPSAYVRAIRMSRAAQILAENGGTVAEVAKMVGYSDPNYFSKVFSRAFGLPPTKYRGENRGD